MAFLDALRGRDDDAIRQSTSLTMAYLLEQNRKFEAYMRQKVVELEARVAGQQARLELPRLSGQAEEEGEPPDFDGAKESADVDTTGASAETGALLAAALMKGLSPPEGGNIWSASGNQLSQDMSLLDDPTPEDTPLSAGLAPDAEAGDGTAGQDEAPSPADRAPKDAPVAAVVLAGDIAAATPEAEEDGAGDELFVPGHALAGQEAVAAASKVETPPGQPSGAARPDLEAPGEEDEDGGGEWDRRLAATGGPVEEYA